MLGKRSRQIRRTTSTSHLGSAHCPMLSEYPMEKQRPRAAAAHYGTQFAPKITQPIIGQSRARENQTPLSDSPTPGATRATRPDNIGMPQNGTTVLYFEKLSIEGPDTSESIPPVDFLDACFYCNRRLGQGLDTYMYRGERAFCSVECRHDQIIMDERREQFSVTAAKKRSSGKATPVPHAAHNGNVVPNGTATVA